LGAFGSSGLSVGFLCYFLDYFGISLALFGICFVLYANVYVFPSFPNAFSRRSVVEAAPQVRPTTTPYGRFVVDVCFEYSFHIWALLGMVVGFGLTMSLQCFYFERAACSHAKTGALKRNVFALLLFFSFCSIQGTLLETIFALSGCFWCPLGNFGELWASFVISLKSLCSHHV